MTCISVFSGKCEVRAGISFRLSASKMPNGEHISFNRHNNQISPPSAAKKKKGVNIGFFK